MLRHGIKGLVACLLIIVSVGAKASCSFKGGSDHITAMKELTMPVNATISVTPDLAVGQRVFAQDIILTGQGALYVECTSSAEFRRGFAFLTAPTSTVLDNVTYPTGVPGIGIRFKYYSMDSDGDFPGTSSGGCLVSRNCVWSGGYGARSWFHLIKTGTVTPGTIKMSTMPVLVYTFGQSGSMLEVYRIKMSGTVKITVPTCNVSTASQAMTVKMGNHDRAAFSGTGSTSDWVDSSIKLDGCGRFYGNTTSAYATFDGTSSNATNALTQNNFTVTLTPRYGVVSVGGKGVMKIKSGTGSATGFGIQLARSKSESGVMNLSSSYAYTDPLPNTGATTITVPLYARYIQTQSTTTAGDAYGMLEFMVAYK